jgi:hypothetical protein
MSDTNGEDPLLRAAQVQRDLTLIAADAEQSRPQGTKIERDTAFDSAVSRAAHRDVAELVARNEAYSKSQAEIVATNRANYAVLEARSLRANLLAERKRASNANFGLGIVSVLLLAALIAGGVWYFSSQNNANTAASAGVVATSASTIKSSDVSAPDRTPGTINVPAASGNP